MADKFGGQKDGRQSTGASFYDVPAVPVNANALYFPNFPASPFFGVAEYPVAAGDLGAFSTSGVFVFDKPVGWIDNAGRKVFYRPKTAATGEIVAQEVKGDVFVGYQVIDNINPQKLGVLLASPEFCMNVLMVTSTADSGAGSLRQAIANAHDGDVILFDSDVFPVGATTSILLSSYITVNKSVSIFGGFNDGQGGYTSGATKRFYVYRDVEGVKTKVYIDDETPAQEGESVLFENVCRVALDGQGATRGASLGSSANIILSGVEFKNNGTVSSGGSCVFQLVDCNFKDSTALNGGGVLLTASAIATIDYCSFYNCTSPGIGGGVYNRNDGNRCYLNNSCFDSCSANSGGAYESYNASQGTFNTCVFYNCSATTNGGGVFSTNTSQNTLTNCIFDGCSAASGGGVFSANTSQNTLNGCVIDGCNARSTGGALYSNNDSINILTNCLISGCSATTNGGGVYSGGTSQNTLNDCTISGCSATKGGGVYTNNTSQNTLNGCNFDALSTVYVANTSALIISDGITTIAAATLNAASTTIADGAALTITTSATIGAATFTSEGRGYLAVGAGIDTSAATLTNVVLCSYGAGLESFDISADGASWTADDLTTPILIETRDDGGDWQTLTDNATGGEYATTFALESTARAFDGVAFFVATLSGYWQADASAVDANDWSVKGFAAANSNGGGDAQGDAAQGWTVTPSTVTPNADGV